MDKLRIRGSENDGFKKLHVASDILSSLKDVFRERAGTVKNGRRNLALASWSANQVFLDMLKTVPDEQIVTMQHNIANASYAVGVRRNDSRTADNDFGIWVSWDTLYKLLDGAHDRCLTCYKSVQEQRQCPLGKALNSLPADRDENGTGCGWFGRI